MKEQNRDRNFHRDGKPIILLTCQCAPGSLHLLSFLKMHANTKLKSILSVLQTKCILYIMYTTAYNKYCILCIQNVHITYLKQPVALKNTSGSTISLDLLLVPSDQPEKGIITQSVRTGRASCIKSSFSSSVDERFQSNPGKQMQQIYCKWLLCQFHLDLLHAG